ncbi:4-hydroxy-tetrahydrodipicolinate synthase [Bacillus sp. FJAT-26390]|uniref:4-hydroxy-tetrahydrodipicolinate synthase n=1 Tax=Bacillus sp. FJAT-26390 TaxID=1743142 RepID=UPI000807B200|nr:4-hydroxy-tetrahydrodipicolinate synthase [Bacillus sp. FJAT-26390]OBZ12959.1 4-hydroxy-tetrahydrodipicolinate synthase [Bacillus sp. FJAT-26390]
MLKEADLKGIFVPVITPFNTNEELDLDSYRRYLQMLCAHEIQGLIINGTTGESPAVSWEEVESLAYVTKESLNGANKQMPLIIGTGTNHTLSTVKRTEAAGQLGADAVLVVTPYYSRPSQEGIVEHFRRVAQVGVPVIAYEVPARTGIRLTADTMRKILDIEGVIGLKDSSGGTQLITELKSRVAKPILCGEDIYLLEMLALGASGGILASANVQTDAFIEVIRLASSGSSANYLRAKQLFDSLTPLIQKLFQESNPSPLKWMLARQGIISSDTLRLPMVSITEELQVQLEQLL